MWKLVFAHKRHRVHAFNFRSLYISLHMDVLVAHGDEELSKIWCARSEDSLKEFERESVEQIVKHGKDRDCCGRDNSLFRILLLSLFTCGGCVLPDTELFVCG